MGQWERVGAAWDPQRNFTAQLFVNGTWGKKVGVFALGPNSRTLRVFSKAFFERMGRPSGKSPPSFRGGTSGLNLTL